MNLCALTRAASVAILAFTAGSLAAATFDVDSSIDSPDDVPGDGICLGTVVTGIPPVPTFRCTLRAAVMEANALGGVHQILIPAGTFHLTQRGSLPEDGTDDSIEDLDLQAEIILVGSGPDTIISGDNEVRIFQALSDPVSIREMTLQDGFAASGGCIQTSGNSLTLSRVTMRGCEAIDTGGALYASCSAASGTIALTIVDSWFDSNTSGGTGAGAHLTGFACAGIGTDITVVGTTFSGNTGTSALTATTADSFSGQNVTISGNSGWGLHLQSTPSVLRHLTIVENTIGIHAPTDTAVILDESIVSRNQTTDLSVNSGQSITSEGFNILGTKLGPGFVSDVTDEITDLPRLFGLGSYGGSTPTRLPAPDSPAVDLLPFGCDGITPTLAIQDQRGLPRPIDGDGDGLDGCDPGAVELQVPDAGLFLGNFEIGNSSEWSSTVP